MPVSGGFRNNNGALPADITVTASPQTIQNTSLYDVDILISGGTITLIEFSRDGSNWFVAGLIAGLFRLSTGDRLRYTYAVAPTVLRTIFR
jgi:hypothetical protein